MMSSGGDTLACIMPYSLKAVKFDPNNRVSRAFQTETWINHERNGKQAATANTCKMGGSYRGLYIVTQMQN